jgi:hypothetical protein
VKDRNIIKYVGKDIWFPLWGHGHEKQVDDGMDDINTRSVL